MCSVRNTDVNVGNNPVIPIGFLEVHFLQRPDKISHKTEHVLNIDQKAKKKFTHGSCPSTS